MIPPILIRSVPEDTSDEVEGFWENACSLHPSWTHVTYRDPIDPAKFPVTSPHWDACTSGAQLAGLVRLEALLKHGGIWLDSDVEVFQPLTPFLCLEAFAGWEDNRVVPDAVLGAYPHHPAIAACLALAIERLHSTSMDWRTGAGAWSTGPGVTTTVLPGRADVLLLPPGSFYPEHYRDKKNTDWATVAERHPYAYGAHRWHASWVPKGA